MRQMDGNLTLLVRRRGVDLRNDLPDSELASYPKAEAADDCATAEVGSFVAVIAHALFAAVVAVNKRSVRLPLIGRLELEFLPARLKVAHTPLDFCVNGLLYQRRDLHHLRWCLADILYRPAVVAIFSFLQDISSDTQT